eukprot:274894_1
MRHLFIKLFIMFSILLTIISICNADGDSSMYSISANSSYWCNNTNQEQSLQLIEISQDLYSPNTHEHQEQVMSTIVIADNDQKAQFMNAKDLAIIIHIIGYLFVLLRR